MGWKVWENEDGVLQISFPTGGLSGYQSSNLCCLLRMSIGFRSNGCECVQQLVGCHTGNVPIGRGGEGTKKSSLSTGFIVGGRLSIIYVISIRWDGELYLSYLFMYVSVAIYIIKTS